jgi:ABC-2 type transport system permease protein
MLLLLARLGRKLRTRRVRSRTFRARTTAARRAPAAGRGLFTLALHQARYDLLALLRNPQARFSTLILPAVLLVAFRSGPGGSDARAGASSAEIAGIAALAVLLACFANLAVSITAQRESGVLKRRRASPVPAAIVIAGRTLTAITVAVASTSTVCAVGAVAYGIRLPATAVPSLAVTAIAGSVTFASLAHALCTAIRSTDAAQPVVQAIVLPLCLVSGVFVPAVELPAWLRDLGRALPLEPLADALRHAYAPALHGRALAWGDLAVLAAWAAVGLAIALRRFTWTPVTA